MYPNLKLQLWTTGIRQNRLAQLLGMDESRLSKMINGFWEPGPELRERIAALVRSDPAWLFERAGKERAPGAGNPTTGSEASGEHGV